MAYGPEIVARRAADTEQALAAVLAEGKRSSEASLRKLERSTAALRKELQLRELLRRRHEEANMAARTDQDMLAEVRRRLAEGRRDEPENSTGAYWQLVDLALKHIAAIPHLAPALAWLRDRCPEVHRQLHGEWPERITAAVGVVRLERFLEILESWVGLHEEISREWYCVIRPHVAAKGRGANP